MMRNPSHFWNGNLKASQKSYLKPTITQFKKGSSIIKYHIVPIFNASSDILTPVKAVQAEIMLAECPIRDDEKEHIEAYDTGSSFGVRIKMVKGSPFILLASIPGTYISTIKINCTQTIDKEKEIIFCDKDLKQLIRLDLDSLAFQQHSEFKDQYITALKYSESSVIGGLSKPQTRHQGQYHLNHLNFKGFKNNEALYVEMSASVQFHRVSDIGSRKKVVMNPKRLGPDHQLYEKAKIEKYTEETNRDEPEPVENLKRPAETEFFSKEEPKLERKVKTESQSRTQEVIEESKTLEIQAQPSETFSDQKVEQAEEQRERKQEIDDDKSNPDHYVIDILSNPEDEQPKEDKKEPEIKQEILESYSKIGLKNIGNTCYMNSVLQSLVHSTFCSQLNIMEVPEAAMLAKAFQRISQRLNDGDQVPPKILAKLKNAVANTNHSFLNYREKDALEFFKSLLEGLDQELTRVTTKPQYQKLRSQLDSGESLQHLSDEWYNYMKAREDSVVHDHFRGQILTINTCEGCNLKRFSFETYWDFPLAFRQEDIRRRRVDIKDMLWTATRKEKVLDKAFCENCDDEMECMNQQKIWRLPETLVFYLKRFQATEQPGMYTKVEVPVEFPTDRLDMSPFVHEESVARNQETNYKLFGAVEHSGTLNGGHYIAVCLNPSDNNWYLFDDSQRSKLRSCKVDQIRSDRAILLFYRKESL